MAYNDLGSNSVSITMRLKMKICLILANTFPLNTIRVQSLKWAGFKIGQKIYIGPSFIVSSILGDKSCQLVISDRVSIGPRVTILLSSDSNWSKLNRKIKPIKSTVTLMNDCWLGAGSIIMPGVTIGEFSIVGAGAVVTKNVPPYTVVVGVPAKVISKFEG